MFSLSDIIDPPLEICETGWIDLFMESGRRELDGSKSTSRAYLTMNKLNSHVHYIFKTS